MKEKYSFIEADNINFQYVGRIDFENNKKPTIIYPGSYIKTKFNGTSVSICLKDYNAYYESSVGYIIDNQYEGKAVIENHDKEIIIALNENLEDKIHDLVLFKRTDSNHYFDFCGIVLDEGCKLFYPGDKPKRRMECYGDSVSAGEVCEAINYVGKRDPEHNGEWSNSWYSYSMITARNLNAELNNNAQGGIGLLNNTGYFVEGTIGLEYTYNKLRFNPQLGKCNDWDFEKFIPNVVIMAIGQNDSHPDNYINYDMKRRKNWKDKYKEIILQLRHSYPNALFILITTILNHDKGWDNALDEIVYEMGDSKIVRYVFKRNGCGTPGHPRISEQKEMADELTKYINSFGEDIWN